MVRFMHEAKSDKAKAELFAAARAGKISVLIGSTSLMGVGTDVQDLASPCITWTAPGGPRTWPSAKAASCASAKALPGAHLPVRNRAHLRRLHVADRHPESQIHRPGHPRKDHQPRRRGHRRRHGRAVLQRGHRARHRGYAHPGQGQSRRRRPAAQDLESAWGRTGGTSRPRSATTAVGRSPHRRNRPARGGRRAARGHPRGRVRHPPGRQAFSKRTDAAACLRSLLHTQVSQAKKRIRLRDDPGGIGALGRFSIMSTPIRGSGDQVWAHLRFDGVPVPAVRISETELGLTPGKPPVGLITRLGTSSPTSAPIATRPSRRSAESRPKPNAPASRSAPPSPTRPSCPGHAPNPTGSPKNSAANRPPRRPPPQQTGRRTPARRQQTR